jgi:hypothetical protein
VTDHGYLYLIDFDNGVLKAGRSDDPPRRVEQHSRDAGRFALRVRHQWTSPRLPTVLLPHREQQLLQLSRHGVGFAAGEDESAERFDVADVVAIVEHPPAGGAPHGQAHPS